MADKSAIEWTDATWPVVQGCDPVSQGCANCYAVPLLWRMAHDPDPKISGPLQGLTELHVNAAGERILRFTGKIALREDRLDWPLKWRQSRMIFVPSHGDLFHKDVPDEFIDKVFAVMALCPQHTFQVLTKRAERMRDYLSATAVQKRVILEMQTMFGPGYPRNFYEDIRDYADNGEWPLPNVWLGVSCERQQEFNEREEYLRRTPAAVRFVSFEPLLESIDARRALYSGQVHWVIVGGESGSKARPALRAWYQDLRDQCQRADVAYFHKQNGEWIDADEWLDIIERGPSKLIVGGKLWEPARPLNYSDAALLAKLTGREDKYEHHSDGTTLIRVGKKAAGRLLDGVEHNEFPKTESASVIEGSVTHHGMSSPDPNQKEAAGS